MTPEDRVRYFLGLPQGYPVHPEHWRNIQGRLMARYVSRDPSPGNVPWGREVTQLRDAPMPQLSRALGMVKPSELAYQGAVPVRGHSEGGQGAYLTPFEMLLLKDTMGDELPGARQEGETVSQARAKARQAAAKRPQNPRMGPVKRKHGGY